MRLTQRLRHYWHEIYYFLAPEAAVRWALKCRDVTARMDIEGRKTGGFRFWLHLSLCQACKNYFEVSEALARAAREYSTKAAAEIPLDAFNQRLIETHTNRRTS